jgi:hypothetical protein
MLTKIENTKHTRENIFLHEFATDATDATDATATDATRKKLTKTTESMNKFLLS